MRNVRCLCAHPFDVPSVTQAKFPETAMVIVVNTNGSYV